MSQPRFIWLSMSACPPGRWDLRLLDWRMLPACRSPGLSPGEPLLLDWRIGGRCPDWAQVASPQCAIAIGVDDPRARAELIEAGFGDALSSQVALVELAARMLKLEGLRAMIPQERQVGPLRLDLFYRDAQADGCWIGLHPREFALLWRLAQKPGERVSRGTLLADVWRLRHEPETNSLEVHVSRLRTKLAISGLAYLLQTHPEGGYYVSAEGRASFCGFSRARRAALDSRPVLTQEYRTPRQDIVESHVQQPRYDRSG